MPNPIVVLELRDWSACIGGEHYTAVLVGYSGKTYRRIELDHPLSDAMAGRLNLKDRNRHNRYRPGDITTKFESEEEAVAAARAAWHQEFPDALVLLQGSFVVADPQPCLEGPVWFRDAANRLCHGFEDYGGYEGNEKGCRRLSSQYQKLVDKLHQTAYTPARNPNPGGCT